MAIYIVELNGEQFDIEGPDNASDEQLHQVALQHSQQSGPKYPIPEDVYNEPGIQNVSLTPVTKPDFEQAGEAIATSKFGQKHPYMGAAVGTPVSMPEEFISAASGLKAAPEIAQGIRGAGSLVKRLGKSLLQGPNAEEISAAQQAMKELPIKFRQKSAILEELDKAARKGIGAAEEKAGLGMKEIPQVPKDISGFANELKVYSQYTPEQLREIVPVEKLQELKKVAQIAKRGNLLPEEQAFINQGVEKIDAAIGQVHPEVGNELGKFREIQDALKSLPEETKAKKEALSALVNRLKTEAKGSTTGKIRNLIGTALRYGTIGAGLGGIHKLMQ